MLDHPHSKMNRAEKGDPARRSTRKEGKRTPETTKSIKSLRYDRELLVCGDVKAVGMKNGKPENGTLSMEKGNGVTGEPRTHSSLK